jgi:uncharacterized protein (DUF58 family)
VTAALRAAVRPPPGRERAAADAVLDRRRIYILPTRQGYAFATVLAVMLLGAINYDNGLGYALAFLLASLALVSTLHTHRNLVGLRLIGSAAGPVFAGGHAMFDVRLDNRGGAARLAVFLRWRDPGATTATCLARVPAGASERGSLPLPAPRRGRLRAPRVTISTRYPLGLFRAWSHVDLDLGCTVYPRPAGRAGLPASAAGRPRDGGRESAGREDFSGFRDYRPGDSPRQIHWKAVAREQGSQLARWVVEAETRGWRYGLAIPGVELAPDSGTPHRHACLSALALFEPSAAGRSPES